MARGGFCGAGRKPENHGNFGSSNVSLVRFEKVEAPSRSVTVSPPFRPSVLPGNASRIARFRVRLPVEYRQHDVIVACVRQRRTRDNFQIAQPSESCGDAALSDSLSSDLSRLLKRVPFFATAQALQAPFSCQSPVSSLPLKLGQVSPVFSNIVPCYGVGRRAQYLYQSAHLYRH